MTSQRDLSFLLNQSAFALAAHLGAALEDLGLSVREYCVLLKAEPGNQTQNVVAEQAGLDRSTMVSTLDALEAAGLAERRISQTDRRARVIALTQEGKTLLSKAVRVVDGVVDEALSVLDSDKRATLFAALEELTEGPWAWPPHTAPSRRKQVPAAR